MDADGHVVTVSRGPPADVVDKFGEFKSSLVADISTGELDADWPAFDILSLGDLVPPELVDAHRAAVAADAA